MGEIVQSKGSKSNQCIKNWEDITAPAMEEMRKEIICKSDKSMEICQLLMLPKSDDNRTFNVKEANREALKLNSCDHSSPYNLPSSTIHSLRLITPLNTLLNSFSDPILIRRLEDFLLHTELHIKRLEKLVTAAYRLDPNSFKGLSLEQVQKIFRIHDLEKLLPFSNLNDTRPYYDELFKNLGRKIDRAIIDRLNKDGYSYLDDLLSKMGITNKEQINAIKDHLLMADETDRVYNPTTRNEEYKHSKVWPRDPKYEEKYPKIIRFYDNVEKYSETVKGLEMRVFTDAERFKYITKMRTREIASYLLGLTNSRIAARAAVDLAIRGTFYGASSFLKSKGFLKGNIALDFLLYSKDTGCSDYKSVLVSYGLDKNGVCSPHKGYSEKMVQFLLEPDNETIKDMDGFDVNKKEMILSDDESCDAFSKVKEIQDNYVKDITCGKNSVSFVVNGTNDIVQAEIENGDIKKLSINQTNTNYPDRITYDYSENKKTTVCLNRVNDGEPCIRASQINEKPANVVRARILDFAQKRKQELAYHIFKSAKSCLDKK